MPLSALSALLETIAEYVDIWKFGWGTSYVDREVRQKVLLLRSHDVLVTPGGTLLEAAWMRGRVDGFFRWADEVGFPAVEVSNGAVAMPRAEKRRLISRAREGFVVLSEVGQKDTAVPVVGGEWAEAAADDLEAGAAHVLVEGRESGRVGLYTPDGGVREALVDSLLARVPAGRLIFEAPKSSQQAWFVRRLGHDVNLGNVRPDEAVGLETLRLGLRADTLAAMLEKAR